MNLNPRAVDNLRDTLFQKLSVKSRVGLVMYAIKHGGCDFLNFEAWIILHWKLPESKAMTFSDSHRDSKHPGQLN